MSFCDQTSARAAGACGGRSDHKWLRPLECVTWPLLRIGDTVLVTLRDGNWCLMNRQPTLVQESMLGARPAARVRRVVVTDAHTHRAEPQFWRHLWPRTGNVALRVLRRTHRGPPGRLRRRRNQSAPPAPRVRSLLAAGPCVQGSNVNAELRSGPPFGGASRGATSHGRHGADRHRAKRFPRGSTDSGCGRRGVLTRASGRGGRPVAGSRISSPGRCAPA